MAAPTTRPERPSFIPNGPRLRALSGYTPQYVREQHSSGRGPLVPILTKLGNRLGVWSLDWDEFAASQRCLPARQADAGQCAANG